jgi:ribosomal protein S18 acetylase RimI-like enzyme
LARLELQETRKAAKPRRGAGDVVLRPARLGDIPELVRVENECFEMDRLSRRSFQRLLRSGNIACTVAVRDRRLVGYVLVLFRRSISLARLYSIAVAEGARGVGLGHQLLAAAEDEALSNDCVYMRLEVHPKNRRAIWLYRDMGYEEFGVFQDYYEDHADAKRMEKRLGGGLASVESRVPFYAQTLEFTCGAAALLMAMKALDPKSPFDRGEEFRLWREATTIFMLSGHGGCGPYGLALAAYRRGFEVEVFVNDLDAFFVDTVRSAQKKEVLRLVENDFRAQIAETDIRVSRGALSVEGLSEAFAEGAVPIVLVSSYRIDRDRIPHWVVVSGVDSRFIYVHDPFLDAEGDTTELDCVNMPIPKAEFRRLARYGKSQLKATVILRRRRRRSSS